MNLKAKDNKFIGAFVNEMYAILIGIGLGNVLFVQQINLNSVFEIMMGLFVTGVVLLYWWDWTEFIDENVVSTKSEFIIDFLILINLEILFLYFNKPLNLSIVFLVLSVLDFLWVINYTRQTSGNYLAKNRKWYMEKILGISIFAASYLIVNFLLTPISIVLSGIIVIFTFVMVRFVSFNQVKKAEVFSLEIAQEDNFATIAEINNHYLGAQGKDSFMITPLSVKKIESRLKDDFAYYVLRGTVKNEIFGFIELSSTAGNEILDNVIWNDNNYTELIMNTEQKVFYIEKVAVNEKYQHQGIGTALYTNLFNRFPYHSFYSFVMERPYDNVVSSAFHNASGFRSLGRFTEEEFCGFSNYQSRLYYRDAKKKIQIPVSGDKKA